MKRLSLWIAAIGLSLLIGVSALKLKTRETITITITGKERISEGSGENLTHKYIIYSKDESFENTDDIMFSKFNSTDFNRILVKDSTYNVTVVGWRVPFLSLYRNIIKIN